jgi:hypothetical protein
LGQATVDEAGRQAEVATEGVVEAVDVGSTIVGIRFKQFSDIKVGKMSDIFSNQNPIRSVPRMDNCMGQGKD